MKTKKSKKGATRVLQALSTTGVGIRRTAPVRDAAFYEIRSAVPLIDGAVKLITHSCSGVKATCADERMNERLSEFVSRRLEGFLNEYLDALLTTGTAVGQILLDADAVSVVPTVLDASRLTIELDEKNPRDVVISSGICSPKLSVRTCPSLTFTSLDPLPERARGRSALESLDGVSSALSQIFDSVRSNWRRSGDVRYAVTYRPADSLEDARGAADSLADAWSAAMRDDSSVRDFVAVGDVKVEPIGGSQAFPEPTDSVRALSEQITAKLGVPPFLLGLSWNTSEAMAHEQAQAFASRVAHYRRVIEPAAEKVCRAFLRVNGCDARPVIQWM